MMERMYLFCGLFNIIGFKNEADVGMNTGSVTSVPVWIFRILFVHHILKVHIRGSSASDHLFFNKV